MFETLITFEKPEYSFQLTQAFVNAIDAAEAEAGNQQRHPSAAAPAPGGNGGSANAAPAPHVGAGQPGGSGGVSYTNWGWFPIQYVS